MPPAAARLVRQPHAPRRGNAAECHHDRRAGRTREPPRDRHGFELAAEVQLDLAGHGQDALAHLRRLVATLGRGFVTGHRLFVVAHRMLRSASTPRAAVLVHGTPTCPASGGMRLLICRNFSMPERRSVPQELAPFRVGGGCPGVFGPNPSAGLDECANSMSGFSQAQALGLAFLQFRRYSAPSY